MSFNWRDWCPLHRQAVAALAAELADLRKFVSENVLNADEASRVAAKLSKADEKFRAVEASGVVAALKHWLAELEAGKSAQLIEAESVQDLAEDDGAIAGKVG